MPKYSAICCYFGRWPEWFRFWLHSCSYNTGIDFIFVTDIPLLPEDTAKTDGEKYVVPENVKVIKMSFPEVQEKIRATFPEIEACIDRPYKLCDFKTAYGYIFREYLATYDYWGFFDIDTIWGDILKFIPENDDAHLAKIFPCGHLAFIKNTPEYIESFKHVNEIESCTPWETVFSTSPNYFYDEEGGFEPLFVQKHSDVYYGGVDFDNVLPPWKYDHFTCINFPEKSHFLIYRYNHGRIYRCYLKGLKVRQEELSYLHISRRALKPAASSEDEFIIYPNVIDDPKPITFFRLLWLGRPRRILPFLRRVMNKIKSK